MTTQRQPAQITTAEEQATLLDEILADVVAAGKDTSALAREDRAALLTGLARRLGLNPLSGAVMFLRTNGRETLYVTKAGTDQIAARERLRRETIRGPEVIEIERRKVVLCQVRATHPDGRSEVSTATLALADPVIDLMKCETKAKRRATLSVCGLGLLAEDEIETIPGGRPAPVDAPPPAPAYDLRPLGIEQPARRELPAVDHFDAARALLDGAGSAEELASARAVIGRDHLAHLGPTERTQIAALRDERARAIAAASAPPDEPPPDAPKGRRRATKTADAAGDGTSDHQPPAEAPAAWLASEEETRAHVAAQRTEWEVQASARKHGRHLAATPWGVRVYAERLQAMGVGSLAQCERYVSAWCAAGPKVRSVAAMPATRAA
jgi:hypothetical protein